MKLEKHHTLPVGISIKHIDWHLKNLDIGYKTIIMLSRKDHMKLHASKNKLKKRR